MKQQSDSISIRPATLEDEADIIEVQCRAISILATKDYSPRQIKALLRTKRQPRWTSEIVFVAEIAGSVVGFGALLDSYSTISAVFVEPNFTRRGVGSLLLRHLEQEAVNHSVRILWVSSSLTGENFYRAKGYQKVERINLVLGFSYIPCIRMKKRLLPITTREITNELIQLLVAGLLICFAIALLVALTKI